MGQSQTWFMYGRDKNDRWTPALYHTLANADDIDFHMGRFKHKVFEFALGEMDIHKLYLYHNWTRHAKAWFEEDTFKIQFSSVAARDSWKTCKRSKRGQSFDKVFSPIEVPDEWVLYFRKNPQELSD